MGKNLLPSVSDQDALLNFRIRFISPLIQFEPENFAYVKLKFAHFEEL